MLLIDDGDSRARPKIARIENRITWKVCYKEGFSIVLGDKRFMEIAVVATFFRGTFF